MLKLSQFPYRAPTKAAYRTGDGRGHLTYEAAVAHANRVFAATGIVIAVETAK